MMRLLSKMFLLVVIASGVLPVTASADKSDKEMMEHRKQMRAQMQRQDAELRATLEEAKKASGEQKIDRIIDVLETMVSQREQMHAQMAAMKDKKDHEGHGGKMQKGGEEEDAD